MISKKSNHAGRKANHIFNISIKLIRIEKLMTLRKSTAIVFVFYDLLSHDLAFSHDFSLRSMI